MDLILGTVQFGMNYGIANKDGQPSLKVVSDILYRAVELGISYFDTASAYGDAEKILGENAEIIKNCKVGSKLSPTATGETVDISIENTLSLIKRQNLDYFLLHRFEHYRTDVWDKVVDLKKQGIVKKIGVSIYDPQQAKQLQDDVDIVQLPFNILDWRWFDFLASKPQSMQIHIRSLFLQGLLLSPSLMEQKGLQHISNKLSDYAVKFGCDSVIELCWRYVRSIFEIDAVVFGVDNKNQLEQHIKYFQKSCLQKQDCGEVQAGFADISENILDVRKWK